MASLQIFLKHWFSRVEVRSSFRAPYEDITPPKVGFCISGTQRAQYPFIKEYSLNHNMTLLVI